VRNHRFNASQETHHLESGGSGVDSSAHPAGGSNSVVGGGTSWLVEVAGGEATVKGCGVAVAMLQEHRWAPTPSKGSTVNVGTTAVVPYLDSRFRLAGGNARREVVPGLVEVEVAVPRLMPALR